VLKVLTDRYGSEVKEGDKAIANRRQGKSPQGGRYRGRKVSKVHKVQQRDGSAFSIDGMCFWTKDGTQIANYPKMHSAKSHYQTPGYWIMVQTNGSNIEEYSQQTSG
jgi:hypothetical protein